MEHSGMPVYREAIALVADLDQRADLADQLRRASASIPLNIAEGASEFAPREKARFYRIARRSAAECDAILDVLEVVGVKPEPHARQQLRGIEMALTALVRHQLTRGSK